MQLVKLICGAKAHANGSNGSPLTIHEGVWAYCRQGADAPGHEWSTTDGLPITEAMRFPRRAAAPPAGEPAEAQPAAAKPAAAKPSPGRARTR